MNVTKGYRTSPFRQPLDFEQLRHANRVRVTQFKNAQGDLAHPNGLDNWSTAEWTNAMCGEAGEAANVAKKIIRGDYGDRVHVGIELLGNELADVVIYADLCAQKLGLNLGELVRHKFNVTSNKVGSEVIL